MLPIKRSSISSSPKLRPDPSSERLHGLLNRIIHFCFSLVASGSQASSEWVAAGWRGSGDGGRGAFFSSHGRCNQDSSVVLVQEVTGSSLVRHLIGLEPVPCCAQTWQNAFSGQLGLPFQL